MEQEKAPRTMWQRVGRWAGNAFLFMMLLFTLYGIDSAFHGPVDCFFNADTMEGYCQYDTRFATIEGGGFRVINEATVSPNQQFQAFFNKGCKKIFGIRACDFMIPFPEPLMPTIYFVKAEPVSEPTISVEVGSPFTSSEI